MWILGTIRNLEEGRELFWRLARWRERGSGCTAAVWAGFSQHYLIGLKGLWNLADALILGLLSPALYLRLRTCHAWSQRDPDLTQGEMQASLHTINSLLAVCMCVASFRTLEWLCLHRAIGELVTIIMRMMVLVYPMAVIITIIAAGFGVAFSALQGGFGLPQPHESLLYVSDHPFLIPWWSMLGAFCELGPGLGLGLGLGLRLGLGLGLAPIPWWSMLGAFREWQQVEGAWHRPHSPRRPPPPLRLLRPWPAWPSAPCPSLPRPQRLADRPLACSCANPAVEDIIEVLGLLP